MVGVRLAELAHVGEDIVQADAEFQGALAGALDDRALGHRVGKRDAQFQDVGPARDQGVHQGDGHLGAGVAGGDEGDEAGFFVRAQGGESGFDSGHVYFLRLVVGGNVDGYPVHAFKHQPKSSPMRSATVCMSLSPRPDRFTRISLSFGSVAASLKA